MMKTAETVVEIGKWTSICNHVKNNRIEYLVIALIAHIVGLTSKAAEHASGVCG